MVTVLRIVNAAIVVVICFQGVQLVRMFLDHEKQELVVQEAPAPADDSVTKAVSHIKLFGPPKAKPPPPPVAALGHLALSGVFVNEAKPHLSMAVIRNKRKGDVLKAIGEEVESGVTLDSVTPEGAVLRNGDRLERLSFPDPKEMIARHQAKWRGGITAGQ